MRVPNEDPKPGPSSKAHDSHPLRILVGISASVVGVVLVGLLDWSTGNEVSLSILYLLPIGLAVWFAGRTTGIVVSCVAAAIWITLDLRGRAVYSHALIPYWNGVVRLGFFLLTTFLLERLRFLNRHLNALVRERTAALVAEMAQRTEAETRSNNTTYGTYTALVNSSGDAAVLVNNVPVQGFNGQYIIETSINVCWADGTTSDSDALTVDYGSTERRATGGAGCHTRSAVTARPTMDSPLASTKMERLRATPFT